MTLHEQVKLYANLRKYLILHICRSFIREKACTIHYIDSKSQNPAEELVNFRGHKIILGTVPGEKATSTVMDGLAVNGKIIIIDASDEPLELYPNSFFFDYRSAVVG